MAASPSRRNEERQALKILNAKSRSLLTVGSSGKFKRNVK